MGEINRIIAAGGGQTVAITGQTIYLKEATAPVRLVLDEREQYRMQPGDKIRVAVPFTGFRVEDIDGAGVDATFVVTGGDYSQSRIAEEVTVKASVPLDVNIAAQSLGDRPYLRAGQTFFRHADSNLGTILVNPPGSGVMIVDPRISADDSGEFVMQPVVLFLKASTPAGNEFGVNKNFLSLDLAADQGQCYLIRAESIDYLSFEYVDNQISLMKKCSRSNGGACFEASFNGAHGGLLIGPGNGIAIKTLNRQSADPISRLNIDFEWIEQKQ